jgi:hypothetical protein
MQSPGSGPISFAWHGGSGCSGPMRPPGTRVPVEVGPVHPPGSRVPGEVNDRPEELSTVSGLVLVLGWGPARLPPMNLNSVRLRGGSGRRAAHRTGWRRWRRSWMTWPPRTWPACPMPCGPSGCWGGGGCWTAWRANGWASSRAWMAAAPPGPSKASRRPRRPVGCGAGRGWAPARPAAWCGPPGPCSPTPPTTTGRGLNQPAGAASCRCPPRIPTHRARWAPGARTTPTQVPGEKMGPKDPDPPHPARQSA